MDVAPVLPSGPERVIIKPLPSSFLMAAVFRTAVAKYGEAQTAKIFDALKDFKERKGQVWVMTDARFDKSRAAVRRFASAIFRFQARASRLNLMEQ